MKTFLEYMIEQQSDDDEDKTGGDSAQDTEGEDDPGQGTAYQTPIYTRKLDKQGGTYVPEPNTDNDD
jgi:hypothetical protein